MKANEFVKNHGWKLVKDLIERGKDQTHVSNDSRMMIDAERYIRECPWFADDVDEMVSLVELKRLVESYELVQKFGGLNTAKKELKKAYDSCSRIICIRKIGFECSYDELSQAIQDIDGVESLKEMT